MLHPFSAERLNFLQVFQVIYLLPERHRFYFCPGQRKVVLLFTQSQVSISGGQSNIRHDALQMVGASGHPVDQGSRHGDGTQRHKFGLDNRGPIQVKVRTRAALPPGRITFSYDDGPAIVL